LARVLVLAIQTKRDSSPRATTGDEAHVPAKTGVEKAGTKKIPTMSNETAVRDFIMSLFRKGATDQY
jgi:hypothetical protein